MRKTDSTIQNSILDVLRSENGVELAILFGSMATGRQRAESDLDLAIDGGRPLSAESKMVLISKLAERIGRPVDLVDLRKVGEPLLGQILKHGIRIFGSNRCYAALIRRHVFDKADFMPYRERILEERRRAWIGN